MLGQTDRRRQSTGGPTESARRLPGGASTAASAAPRVAPRSHGGAKRGDERLPWTKLSLARNPIAAIERSLRERALFRDLHTLKGSSGFAGLTRLIGASRRLRVEVEARTGGSFAATYAADARLIATQMETIEGRDAIDPTSALEACPLHKPKKA